MQADKVAIVVDNDLGISQQIINKIKQKHNNVQVIDFSRYNIRLFGFWKSLYLMQKIESLNLSEFDKVYTISLGFANGIITNSNTQHINLMVGLPNWYFEPKSFFLKHHIRRWIQLSLERGDEYYIETPYLDTVLQKLNKTIVWKKSLFLKSSKQELVALDLNEEKDYFVLLCSNMSSLFCKEIAHNFNKTGKKLKIIYTQKNLQSLFWTKNIQCIKDTKDLTEIFKSCRGLLIDQNFNNFGLLNKYLNYSKSFFVYRNKTIQKLLPKSHVVVCSDLSTLENDLAQFVSFSKKTNRQSLNFAKWD